MFLFHRIEYKYTHDIKWWTAASLSFLSLLQINASINWKWIFRMTWNLMSKPGHRALRLQPVREAQGLTEQLTPAGTAPWVRRLFLIQSLHLGAFLPFPSPLWTWCFHLGLHRRSVPLLMKRTTTHTINLPFWIQCTGLCARLLVRWYIPTPSLPCSDFSGWPTGWKWSPSIFQLYNVQYLPYERISHLVFET